MRKFFLYYLLFAFFVLITSSCTDLFTKKKTSWDITLKKEDKKPYGTYLAYHSLKYYFPDAKIDSLSRWFRYTSIDDKMMYPSDGAALLVMVGLDFYVSENEWYRLLQFAKAGNEIIVFCNHCDNKAEELFKFYKRPGYEEIPLNAFNNLEKNNDSILHFTSSDSNTTYGYKGRSLQGHFLINDSVALNDTAIYTRKRNYYFTDKIYVSCNPDTLGMVGRYPDFIRYSVGGGHITLHAAPLVLSNYFLLQKRNKNYLDGIWHTFPTNISKVYWNDYYKRSSDSSYFGALLRFPATRWAFWLAIFALLLYVLFEGKRRQRIIPIITPLQNTSVTFVETVGRLYFNKGNHANMAEKMTQHFLEWIRTHYYLNTNELNEAFIKQLSLKSGQPENNVRYLVEMIHDMRLRQVNVDEPYLYELYKNIQQFYKNYK